MWKHNKKIETSRIIQKLKLLTRFIPLNNLPRYPLPGIAKAERRVQVQQYGVIAVLSHSRNLLFRSRLLPQRSTWVNIDETSMHRGVGAGGGREHFSSAPRNSRKEGQANRNSASGFAWRTLLMTPGRILEIHR
ncbi:hypothetical protein CDAR_378921 [Caerostris darwini]|uniref:Uncharacterized protein n=1 Tax=Caerostris darwini TaxID=1538125 RepID=A0AAV4TXA7_9ARAC|nr:hypothetical protein CDAR_378921 [Caerostris darwini]